MPYFVCSLCGDESRESAGLDHLAGWVRSANGSKYACPPCVLYLKERIRAVREERRMPRRQWISAMVLEGEDHYHDIGPGFYERSERSSPFATWEQKQRVMRMANAQPESKRRNKE